MNNLDKQFVTYETALKLKELGFDEKCFKYYESDKRLIWFDYDHSLSNYVIGDAITAPLWQQVIDWFRKEYDIHINIDRNVHEDVWKYNIVTIHQPGVYLIQSIAESRYNSIQFSRVREQAILKAIELIKNGL